MGLRGVREKLITFAFSNHAGVLELVDNPDLGSGGASRGGSSPPTRTKPCPAFAAGRFRTRAGGLRLFTVTPSLNSSPRGRDSAAEAAVRLMAKSLRSEDTSIQGSCSARAVFSRFSHRFGTEHLATPYLSINYKTTGAKPPVFPRGLEPYFLYCADNQKDTGRVVPTLW